MESYTLHDTRDRAKRDEQQKTIEFLNNQNAHLQRRLFAKSEKLGKLMGRVGGVCDELEDGRMTPEIAVAILKRALEETR